MSNTRSNRKGKQAFCMSLTSHSQQRKIFYNKTTENKCVKEE